jgi:hypothetical protein
MVVLSDRGVLILTHIALTFASLHAACSVFHFLHLMPVLYVISCLRFITSLFSVYRNAVLTTFFFLLFYTAAVGP